MPYVPPNLATFPPEVLLRLFKAAMPAYHEYDPAALRPRNPWLGEIRFRKGLPLVCKAWLWPATAVLYEDIVLRRMGQIPALARTLSSATGRDLAPLIQHIRLDTCVIWAPCADVVRQDLSFILQHSVALRSFSMHANPNFPIANHPDEGNSWDGFNPAWILEESTSDVRQALQSRLRAGLRELDISMTLSEAQIVELHGVLSSTTGLTSLKVGPVSNAAKSTMPNHSTLPQLTLKTLTDLQLYIDHHPFVELVRLAWRMPALIRLTAMNCREVPIELLRSHGRNLTYLHICPKKNPRVYDYSWEVCATTHLDENLPNACPMLEHLVFPATPPDRPVSSILLALRSQTLLYLDIWCHASLKTREEIEDERDHMVESGRTPVLKRIRRLRRIVRPDLPLICHPTLVSGDEVRLHRFPASAVVQTSWAVVPDSGKTDDIPWFVHLPPSDDETSTFVPDSEDEEEDEDEEGADEDDEEAHSAASDESPYDPFNPSSSAESSQEETDSDYDSDIDAEISDSEQNVEVLMEERLQEQYDRNTVLAMFQRYHEHHHEEEDEQEDED